MIRTQLKIDKTTLTPTKLDVAAVNKYPSTVKAPQFTYHFTCSKGKTTPSPVTQYEVELQPTVAATTGNTSWRLDGESYKKTNVNPPLAGISQGALTQFMGDAFLEELKQTAINATPLELEEVANGVVNSVTKETITKHKKLIEDPFLRETWPKAMCK